MNKINALLNKADFFEKLAIHGSRRHALKSLAQDQATLNKAKKELEACIPLFRKIPDYGSFSSRTREEGALLGVGDITNTVHTKKDLTSVIENMRNNITEIRSNDRHGNILDLIDLDLRLDTAERLLNDNSIHTPFPIRKAVEYPSIDPAMQKKIRDYAVSIGLSFSDDTTLRKTEDGKLGPVTRGIIEDIKQHFKDSDPYDDTPMGPQGDQELFKTITYLSKNKAPQNNEPEPVDNTSGDIASRLLRRDPKDHITDYNTPMPKLRTLL